MARGLLRLGCLAIMSLVGFIGPAAAQKYPDRVVRIVVPFAAGGSNDVLARIVAQHLTDNLGQQFIVENRAGAGGNVGAESVAKAAPDGYTLLLTAPGPLAINNTLYNRLPFDPAKDFAPVALIATVPIVLVVHPKLPAQNLKELIALAEKEQASMNYGSAGIGSTHHLAAELFKTMTKTGVVHVAFRGASPAMTALVGGHIQMMFENMPACLSQITSGDVRAIAVAGATRAVSLPNVPTMAEAGLPGFDAFAWHGLVAPAQTPPAIVKLLTAEVAKILKKPEVVERFHQIGAEPGTFFGEEFGGFLRAESAKWGEVIRASGAKAD